MSVFSKKFPSFFDWLAAHPNAGTPAASTYEKRIIKAQLKGKNLSGARGHTPEPIHRTTIGTGISNKKEHLSLTVYAFKLDSFDETDIDNLETILMRETVKALYPNKSYDDEDFWGNEKFIRREKNAQIPREEFDHELDHWYFEINGDQTSNGAL